MGYAAYLAVTTYDETISPAKKCGLQASNKIGASCSRTDCLLAQLSRDLAYRGLQFYWAQLALNLGWNTLFFGLKKVRRAYYCSDQS